MADFDRNSLLFDHTLYLRRDPVSKADKVVIRAGGVDRISPVNLWLFIGRLNDWP